jgi:hypothetical protein
MRTTLLLKLGPGILFTMHQLLPCLPPLEFSPREMVMDLQLGQREIDKMGRVPFLLCFSLKWDPNPFFYRPKGTITVGVNGYGQSNGLLKQE